MDANEIGRRWREIDAELDSLWAGRVVDGCPTEREAALLEEQDALEYEAGRRYFEERCAGT